MLTATPTAKRWVTDAKGYALKVVAPLLSSLPIYDQKQVAVNAAKETDIRSSALNYRVLFMERPMEQILDSQRLMLGKLGKPEPKGNPTKGYRQQVRAAKTWLLARDIPAMSVDYTKLVHQPNEILPQLAAFLGCPEKLEAMQAVIDPSMHRARESILKDSLNSDCRAENN